MSADEQPKPASTWPLFPPEPEVSSDNPFAEDRLDRKIEAEQLMTLIEHCPTPLVLSLDAAWGTGKTTFVRMWRQSLENAHYKTIHFNAWETDFIAEPLVALVGEVARLLPRKTQAARTAQQKLKTATGLILKKATPIAIRLLTAGLLDIKAEDLKGASISAEDLEEALSETAEKVVEGAIDQYERHRNEVAEFRKALQEAVQLAAGGKPLIFFVDELDRCRPTFAVELLERIKHLFEVPGVIFVLSVHREQLGHSLKAIYGHDFDADGYLARFFHLTYRLAEPKPGEYTKYLIHHVGFGAARMMTAPLAFLMTHLHLTLRQQQRCVSRVALVLRMVGSGRPGDDATVYATLVVVREWDSVLYRQFLSGQKTADDLLDALEAVEPDRWAMDRESREIEAGLLFLETERREAMRSEDDKLQRWKSRRLQRYEQEIPKDTSSAQPGSRVSTPRGARIVERVAHQLQDPRRFFSDHSNWRRALSIVELGERFELLEERPH
jgi:hypothetical protein